MGEIGDQAREKLQNELENAEENTLAYAKPIIEYLLSRCDDAGFASDIMQKHKTWEKCFEYVKGKAHEQQTNGVAVVADEVVYEWAEDYYHIDDKEEEERKAKKAEEQKKKAEELKQVQQEQKKIREKPKVNEQLNFFDMINQGGGA